MSTGISSKPVEKVHNANLYFKYTNILIKITIPEDPADLQGLRLGISTVLRRIFTSYR
jgi:hypothetical protein